MFKDRIAGDQHHARQVADYYDKAKVHFDQIVFRIFTDTTAATQNLRSGDIQALDRRSATDIAEAQGGRALRR